MESLQFLQGQVSSLDSTGRETVVANIMNLDSQNGCSARKPGFGGSPASREDRHPSDTVL